MPSFARSSSIRVASQDHVLRLKITHNLVHGLPSDAVHSVDGRLPKELDVLWLSDLTISLSGSFDGRQIPAHDIARSGLVRHLKTQLKANADQLGLNNISRLFVDDADGFAKLTLTPSRPLPHTSRPHAILVSLHLVYIWRTVSRRSDVVNSNHSVEEANPFSPSLFLPTEALLNRVTEQFLIYHLVGRYPLVFGPWCKRLDLEMQYFPSVGHSIVEIMTRSKNQWFSSKCKRLIKVARRNHKLVLQSCITALSSCTDDTAESETSEMETDSHPETAVLTDEQVLCESLEQLFRMGVTQRRFKPLATPQLVSLPQDDDDSLLPYIPDAGTDDEVPWVELPEIATSACALETLLLEQTDVFATEGWSGDMWRLHGSEREYDAQSDESLISASIPLASITTRPPQACSSALYHHLDVDRHEPDPAMCGLRFSGSQLTWVEDPESPALPANLTRSPSHASRYHSETYEDRVDCEGFETLEDEVEEVEDVVELDWDD